MNDTLAAGHSMDASPDGLRWPVELVGGVPGVFPRPWPAVMVKQTGRLLTTQWFG